MCVSVAQVGSERQLGLVFRRSAVSPPFPSQLIPPTSLLLSTATFPETRLFTTQSHTMTTSTKHPALSSRTSQNSLPRGRRLLLLVILVFLYTTSFLSLRTPLSNILSTNIDTAYRPNPARPKLRFNDKGHFTVLQVADLYVLTFLRLC